MSKQQKSKKPIASDRKTANAPLKEPGKSKNKNLIYWVLIAFTFIVYGNSILNDYALDDIVVVSQNEFVQKGFKGIKDIMTTDMFVGFDKKENALVAGGRYRPLSLITLAIEYQFLELSPHFSHFINVLLFAFCGIGVFIFIRKLLNKHSPLKHLENSAIPLIAAILYIAHPIHTEAVANIKSRDEILSLLFCLFSTISFLNYIDKGQKIKYLVIGFVLFFLALLSKENSFTFLLIIPMTIWFFRKASVKDYLMIGTPLVIAGGIFWVMRNKFAGGGLDLDVHNILNNPFLGATAIQKYATITYTIGKYFLLLIFPSPLSSDYDYNVIPLQSFSDISVIVSLLVIIALAVIAIMQFMKRTILSYSILFFAITFSLVSNIIFPIGTTMTERFIFIPSLGFCFIVAYYINKLASPTLSKSSSNKTDKETIPGISILKNKTCLFILVVLTGLYSIKTIARNMDWKDNMSLFTADVVTSPNSANLNKDIGNSLVDAGKLITNKKHQADTFNLAKPYLKKAMKIYSGYTDAYRLLGFIYYMENKFDSAFYYNAGGLKVKPDDAELNYNQGKVLDKQKKYDEAIKVLNHAIEINPKYEGAYFNLALSYTNKGDGDKGLEYFKKVIELNPKRADAYYYSGLLYQAKRDSVKAKEFLDKSKELGGVKANSNN